MTIPEIHIICKRYEIDHYIILENRSLDVFGNVNLSNSNLIEIPILFNCVSGNFTCCHNKIELLVGLPKHVGGDLCFESNSLIFVPDNFKLLSKCDVTGEFYLDIPFKNALKRYNEIMSIIG